jgi:hypothetical protein
VAGQSVALTKVSELTKFPAEGALVGARHAVGALRALGRAWPRVLECSSARVVVHEVPGAFFGKSDFPTGR